MQQIINCPQGYTITDVAFYNSIFQFKNVVAPLSMPFAASILLDLRSCYSKALSDVYIKTMREEYAG